IRGEGEEGMGERKGGGEGKGGVGGYVLRVVGEAGEGKGGRLVVVRLRHRLANEWSPGVVMRIDDECAGGSPAVKMPSHVVVVGGEERAEGDGGASVAGGAAGDGGDAAATGLNKVILQLPYVSHAASDDVGTAAAALVSPCLFHMAAASEFAVEAAFLADCTQRLQMTEGYLELLTVPPGYYSLFLPWDNETISIRVLPPPPSSTAHSLLSTSAHPTLASTPASLPCLGWAVYLVHKELRKPLPKSMLTICAAAVGGIGAVPGGRGGGGGEVGQGGGGGRGGGGGGKGGRKVMWVNLGRGGASTRVQVVARRGMVAKAVTGADLSMFGGGGGEGEGRGSVEGSRVGGEGGQEGRVGLEEVESEYGEKQLMDEEIITPLSMQSPSLSPSYVQNRQKALTSSSGATERVGHLLPLPSLLIHPRVTAASTTKRTPPPPRQLHSDPAAKKKQMMGVMLQRNLIDKDMMVERECASMAMFAAPRAAMCFAAPVGGRERMYCGGGVGAACGFASSFQSSPSPKHTPLFAPSPILLASLRPVGREGRMGDGGEVDEGGMDGWVAVPRSSLPHGACH
ncbi:unnamed protein product, partial [Closterium sp. Naga37s-1]